MAMGKRGDSQNDVYVSHLELPQAPGHVFRWLDISQSKFYDWRKRYGKVNEHNGKVPRDFWLLPRERQAIIGYSTTVLSGDRVSFNAAPNSTAKYDDLGFCAVFPGRSFHDAFDDNNYTALPTWTTFGGSWSAASGDMANTAYGTGTSGFYRSVTDDDFVLNFTYTSSDTSSSAYWAWIGTSDQNRYILAVENTGLKIIKVESNVYSTPVSKYGLTTTQGQAYDVQMTVDGKRIEVWRGLAGQEKSLLFSWDDATLFSSGNRLTFRVSANARYRFDNISFNTPDPQRAGHWYNAANELTMAQENGRITRYTYDDWGRTVAKSQGSYAAAYQYRPGDMLKRVDTNFPGETTVRYLVDGLMRRRYEGVNTGTNFSTEAITTYRYDLGWNALAEYGGSIDGSGTLLFGTRQESYVYHGMTPLAEIASANPGTGAAAYFAHDHLGSTRGLYNANKASVATTNYDPYGNLDPGNTGSPAFTYTGKPWADEVDMYHFPYRYYQPQAGRWLTRDPLGMVDGPNVYGYVSSGPTNRIDVYGLQWTVRCTNWDESECGPLKWTWCTYRRNGLYEVMEDGDCTKCRCCWRRRTTCADIAAAKFANKILQCKDNGPCLDAARRQYGLDMAKCAEKD